MSKKEIENKDATKNVWIKIKDWCDEWSRKQIESSFGCTAKKKAKTAPPGTAYAIPITDFFKKMQQSTEEKKSSDVTKAFNRNKDEEMI